MLKPTLFRHLTHRNHTEAEYNKKATTYFDLSCNYHSTKIKGWLIKLLLNVKFCFYESIKGKK